MNKEYKTFEELKEELGDKFEKYMYGANVNLLNNWNELKKWLEEELTEGRSTENQWLMGCYDQIKEILNKMQELEGKSE